MLFRSATLSFATASLLALAPVILRADEAKTPPNMPQGKEWCKKNPEECAKRREERKARLRELKAKCDADPVKCEEKKKELKARCDADPAKCEQKKQEMRQMRMNHMEGSPKSPN